MMYCGGHLIRVQVWDPIDSNPLPKTNRYKSMSIPPKLEFFFWEKYFIDNILKF